VSGVDGELLPSHLLARREETFDAAQGLDSGRQREKIGGIVVMHQTACRLPRLTLLQAIPFVSGGREQQGGDQ
jgi:hypothetical protein